MREKEYKVLGMMSGTSLDGVDLAYCHFKPDKDKWHFRIEAAETVSYNNQWKSRLSGAHLLSCRDLIDLDIEYGAYLGGLARDFFKKGPVDPGFIASHGHTVFHQPEKGITLQVGNGSVMAAKTGIPVAHDFRSLDVSLHGQGAPLVPIGDRLLFGDYDICLNLGGFSNVSLEKDKQRIAFDISPCNIVLNRYTKELGLDFDDGGINARRGKVDEKLLGRLDGLGHYRKKGPKSLGREWLERAFYPIVDSFNLPVDDILRTLTEHIAGKIARVIAERGVPDASKILITGGGAGNSFLLERISDNAGMDLGLPDPLLIDFKEALVFAFLGVLRSRGEINTLSSVTGAIRDSSGGIICCPS